MTLRVKLEVVPHGDESNVREIGRLDIFNKGPAPFNGHARDDAGYYEYGVISLNPGDAGLYDATALFYRKNGAWALVQSVLNAFPVRGPK